MAKRSLDLGISLVGLVILSPLLITTLIIIWAQDFGNPFYISERVGLNGKKFKIYKLRSMILDADKSGVDSTSDNDSRITKVGMFIRKFKLDEVSQLIIIWKYVISWSQTKCRKGGENVYLTRNEIVKYKTWNN